MEDHKYLIRFTHENDPPQPWIFIFCTHHANVRFYVRIEGTFHEARAEMFRRFGDKWDQQYTEPEGMVIVRQHGLIDYDVAHATARDADTASMEELEAASRVLDRAKVQQVTAVREGPFGPFEVTREEDQRAERERHSMRGDWEHGDTEPEATSRFPMHPDADGSL